MSIRRLGEIKGFQRLKALKESEETFNATVVKISWKGCEMLSKGMKAFLPMSHMFGGPHTMKSLNATLYKQIPVSLL